MNMPACALFNEQNKGPNLLSIITRSVLGKQNVQAEKVYMNRIHIVLSLSISIFDCYPLILILILRVFLSNLFISE